MGEFSFSLSRDFLDLSLACPDDRYSIYIISRINKILTLKELSMGSSPDITLPSFFFVGRVVCLE